MKYLGAIRNAGAIFLGAWTPEAVGDYVAGPNHTLPTGGTARYSSPLSVDDFVKKSSIIQYSPAALKNDARAVVQIATHEGLWAHARSVALRLKALLDAEQASVAGSAAAGVEDGEAPVSTALGDIEAGEWSNIAATNGNFGLEDGDYVGLPTADDSWNFKTFTKDEYETLKSKIASGELVVDNSSDDATKPTVSEFNN